jgi:hypothetical protein
VVWFLSLYATNYKLAGAGDKSMLARLEDIATLPTTKRLEVFNVIDAYIRDFKTSKAYATK